jgi:hypothetical protein
MVLYSGVGTSTGEAWLQARSVVRLLTLSILLNGFGWHYFYRGGRFQITYLYSK